MKLSLILLTVLLGVFCVYGQECVGEGEKCNDTFCCHTLDTCTISENGIDKYCVRQECLKNGEECYSYQQCCSGFCKWITFGAYFCAESTSK